VDEYSNAQSWLVKFRLGVIASGVVWGSAGFLMFPPENSQLQMFLVLVLVALTAGGITSYSADLVSGILFSVLILFPLGTRLFVAGDSVSVAMGVAMTIYLGFMIMSVRHINRHIIENFRMRLESINREKSVMASEERHRLLLRYSPVGILHYDTSLIITYCNDQFAEILQSSIDLIIGLNINTLNDLSVLPAMKNALKGELGHYEGHFFDANRDANLCISMNCAPSRDTNGKIVGGIAIVHDITLQKMSETELRIAATAFQTQECIVIADADGVILRVNQAYTDITGYTAEEAVGKQPRFLKTDIQNAEFHNAIRESLGYFGVWRGYMENRRKNGEIYPQNLAITAVKDKTGKVINFVATFTDITKDKAAEEEIRNLAFFDPLTKLPNRRLFRDRLDHALASSARNGREGALLFIDLDNFKTINDTLGHDFGDMLLQQVAERLTACVREGDTVSRLGGDEFMLILEDLSKLTLEAAEQTELICEKILLSLNMPYQLGTHESRNTPSIGATLLKGHQFTADQLIKQADIAMYQAKKAGRNTLRFFDPMMQDAINIRALLEQDLRKALENQEFQLYFQLQVDNSHHPLGAEALIRWIHPTRGMVSLAELIPLAEETRLILPIGQWILDTACAQLVKWQQDELSRDLVLAVNFSAFQFHQPDIVSQVKATIQRHACNPNRLKLELTESMLLENIEETIANMTALKEVGVQFSLDDFGTGYSSLQYLKRLPIDQIKIDQLFVRDLVVGKSDKAIVRTIIAMAHSLDMDVIAEGVETEEQRQLLLNKGCTHFQGYLFGKPVSIEKFEENLKSNSD
jgi:diguanylate cyclase (GGDEF)-like protein/PAS domain S-box-containing protein